MKTFVQLKSELVEAEVVETQGIKGWKNAHSDIMRNRAAQRKAGMPVYTVKLKKDGKESGMHDAKKGHKSVEDAYDYHKSLERYNPGKKIQHNLYVDGKFVEKLGA